MLSFSCYYYRILLKTLKKDKKGFSSLQFEFVLFSNGFSYNGVMKLVLISVTKVYFRFQITVL